MPCMTASKFLRGTYDAAHAGLKKVVEAHISRFDSDYRQAARAGSALADKLINRLDEGDIDGAKQALSGLSGCPGMDALVAAGIAEFYPASPATPFVLPELVSIDPIAPSEPFEIAPPAKDLPTAPYPTLLSVHLKKVGKNKIDVIRVIREVTGLGLREVKDLIENTPVHLVGGLTVAEAGAVADKLSAVGATADVK